MQSVRPTVPHIQLHTLAHPKAQRTGQHIQQGFKPQYPKHRGYFSRFNGSKPAVINAANSIKYVSYLYTLLPDFIVSNDVSTLFQPEREYRLSTALVAQLSWMRHPPNHRSRLAGWKESNILYTGSITYHS